MAGCTLAQAARVGLAGLLIGVGLAGCGKKAETPAAAATESAAKSETATAAAPTTAPTASAAVAGEARLSQSFAEATLSEPPQGSELPPPMTLSQKSVGKLYTQVINLWD